MELRNLIAKMTAIEEGAPVAPVHTDSPAEEEGIIIGGPMPGMMGQPHQPEQQDTVTMNVSMNGSGAGGIKDLMNILRNIEHGDAPIHGVEHGHEEPLLGDDEFEETMGDDKETWGNSAHGDVGHHVHGIDAVTQTGNDLASKGGQNPHFSPGNNTLRASTTVHENLVSKLTDMYNTIKEERTEEKDDKGNVVRWKEDSGWRKAEKKDGRGKVTNMSDKARRETEKMSKKEIELAEWGVNLTQPQSDMFGTNAPKAYNDHANTNAMMARYNSMIEKTKQEIERLEADPTIGGTTHANLLKMAKDQLDGLDSEQMHNLTGTGVDDASNALRKQAIANNELTPGQWLQKATQYFKGKMTGQPQPGVSYDRYDTSKQAEKGWTTPTPYTPESINELADILKLAKMLRG